MISKVEVDGIYRPEEQVDGSWLIVAYVTFRGAINRKVHCESHRGKTIPARFEYAIDADKVCKQLNNEQPKGKVGADINGRNEWQNAVRCESSGQIRDRSWMN